AYGYAGQLDPGALSSGGLAGEGLVAGAAGILRDRRCFEIGPDRMEHGQPLLGSGGDEPLEGARLRLQVRGDPFAARSICRERDLLGAGVIDAARLAPHTEDIRRDAGVEG